MDIVDRLRGWAQAYRDGPKEMRFSSDPHGEFFPPDMEAAAAEITRLRKERDEARAALECIARMSAFNVGHDARAVAKAALP